LNAVIRVSCFHLDEFSLRQRIEETEASVQPY